MFDVGYRVVCKSDDAFRELLGKRGTVRDIDGTSVLVEFDDFMNGHDGNNKCKDGHGWWCDEDVLALVTVSALKFKKGDNVIVKSTEHRNSYKCVLECLGTIVDAEHQQYLDDERTTYRVRIDNLDNKCQIDGLWVFHEEKSLELYNTQNDDKMDAYKYAIAHTRYSITEIDDIIKGDYNMNNILEIYESRKANKLFEETKTQSEKVKMADPTYKAWKTAVDTINKIYAKDIDVYGEICPREPKLSEKSEEKLKELNSSYSNQRREIEKEIEEIKAQLSICETYEQKQNVLKLYNVINADGKING